MLRLRRARTILLANLLLFVSKAQTKSERIPIISVTKFHNTNALLRVSFRSYFNMQSKAIEQLWPKFTLFWIARSDQNEPGRMLDGNSFALNSVYAARSHIQQQINQMIVEEVYFVDIKKPAICASKQCRAQER